MIMSRTAPDGTFFFPAGAGGEAAAGRVQVPGPHSRVQGADAGRRGPATGRGAGPAGALAGARRGPGERAGARPPAGPRPPTGRRAELARRRRAAAEPARPPAAERGPGGRAAVGRRGAPPARRRRAVVVPLVRGRGGRIRRAGPVRRAVQRVAAVRAAALQHRRQVVRARRERCARAFVFAWARRAFFRAVWCGVVEDGVMPSRGRSGAIGAAVSAGCLAAAAGHGRSGSGSVQPSADVDRCCCLPEDAWEKGIAGACREDKNN
jgi:hypothetical protein